jgi:acyl carrier protein
MNLMPQPLAETDVDRLVRNAWMTVLDTDRAQDDDNFFALGGDSVSAMRLMEQVEAALVIEFPLRTLLTDGRLSALVEACVQLHAVR